MLDTVILMMERPHFEIERHEMFTPSTAPVFERPQSVQLGRGKVCKYTNMPTARQKSMGCWPRLTLIVRPSAGGGGLSVQLKVEFSAPKILFGNNFDELTDDCFNDLLQTLVSKMKEMGVLVTAEGLAQAQVSAIHYSKNVLLTDYTRCTMVLQELAKLNVWSRLDVNSKDFRDGGHVLKWHSNSFEICAYDKVKDLQKARISPKRAEEDDPLCQIALFEDLKQRQLQVLRLEIRLNKRDKIRRVLNKLCETNDMSFQMMFQERLAAKVLNHYWAELMAHQSTASLLEIDLRNPAQFAEALMAEYPNMGAKQVLYLLGATGLIQEHGEKGLSILFSGQHPRTVARLISECKAHQPSTTPRWTAVRQVKQQLESFQPLRLATIDEAHETVRGESP